MSPIGWVLIIILNGWGAGQGSTGNAVGTAWFSTEEKCLSAIHSIQELKLNPTAKYVCVRQ